MSQNVDLVRSIYADWARGDFGSIDWADPDVELVAIGGPDPGRTTGRAAMREGWRDFLSAWRDYRVTGEEFRELAGGRVLVFNRIGGRGRAAAWRSGVRKRAAPTCSSSRTAR